jgi:hypothetical protein
MKEIRVYVVVSEDEKWQYATDNAFMLRAERDGNVWSLAGFANAWNNENWCVPDPDYSYIRIMEVDTETGKGKQVEEFNE